MSARQQHHLRRLLEAHFADIAERIALESLWLGQANCSLKEVRRASARLEKHLRRHWRVRQVSCHQRGMADRPSVPAHVIAEVSHRVNAIPSSCVGRALVHLGIARASRTRSNAGTTRYTGHTDASSRQLGAQATNAPAQEVEPLGRGSLRLGRLNRRTSAPLALELRSVWCRHHTCEHHRRGAAQMPTERMEARCKGRGGNATQAWWQGQGTATGSRAA